MLNLPSSLGAPVIVEEKVASKVVLDLTVYLAGPSEEELEYLFRLYEGFCAANRRAKYKISELVSWAQIARPVLTASGRAAYAAGISRPHLEPVRRRIREGRAFEVGFWDGRTLSDPDGSWSFRSRSIHLRATGLHAFARINIPINQDYQSLRATACAIADNVELYSGHAGLAFSYDPWLKEAALDAIYAQSRRFWGVDVEQLDKTLPLMKESIKGVSWITLVGRKFTCTPKIQAALADLAKSPNVTIDQRKHAIVLVAGNLPVAGDQHRPDRSLEPYYAVANALRPLFLKVHPDLSSRQFVRNGNTVGWIRRFIDPAGWR